MSGKKDSPESAKSSASRESAKSAGKTNKLHTHYYIGLSLALVWYHCLWFSPLLYTNLDLLNDTVTDSWLMTLGTAGVFFFVLPPIVKRLSPANRARFDSVGLFAVSAIILAVATALFPTMPHIFERPVLYLGVFPVVFGLGNATIWIAWGSLLARTDITFSVKDFSLVFGATMLVAIVLTSFTFFPFANIVTAALPLASLYLYARGQKYALPTRPSILLPKTTRRTVNHGCIIISAAIFVACMACYYDIAIIPVSTLDFGANTYPLAIACAALVCILIGVLANKVIKDLEVYSLIPMLFVFCAIALALYVNGNSLLYTLSFMIAVALAGVFEIFLTAYFGAMTAKGYLSTAVAFGFSSGVIRLGFLAGDWLACFYERTAFALPSFVPTSTALIMMVLLLIAVIPLLRQEGVIFNFINAPSSTSEIDRNCQAIIEEFGLSPREGEILRMIGRGISVNGISEKLFISPYTTQTHIRHIYTKMNIHKRSELLDYINMHREQ
jgi:DNA-binding CsgD family transcriptional regulator